MLSDSQGLFGSVDSFRRHIFPVQTSLNNLDLKPRSNHFGIKHKCMWKAHPWPQIRGEASKSKSRNSWGEVDLSCMDQFSLKPFVILFNFSIRSVGVAIPNWRVMVRGVVGYFCIIQESLWHLDSLQVWGGGWGCQQAFDKHVSGPRQGRQRQLQTTQG